MKFSSHVLVSLTMLALGAGCTKSGNGGGSPDAPQSPTDNPGDEPNDQGKAPDAANGPTVVDVVSGDEIPDLKAAALALAEESGPEISYGPVASRTDERQFVCRYTALAYAGSTINVSVQWQRADGSAWSPAGDGDFLTLKDDEVGKEFRCQVSARDGKGREISLASASIK